MSILEKDVKYYWKEVAPILQYTPAYSYITTQYTSSSSSKYNLNDSLKLTINPKKIRQPDTNEIISIKGDTGESLNVMGLTSRPSSGSKAIKVTVNVPASYSWIYPNPILTPYNNYGWNASAVSISKFTNYGETTFRISTKAVGIHVGLTTVNDAVDSFYTLIRYSIYATLGKFRIFINGLDTGFLESTYSETDVFKIVLGKSGVTFYKNDIEIYNLNHYPEPERYRLDTSIYSSGDKILDATIKEVSYASIANTQFTQYVNVNGIDYEVINDRVFINGIWYTIHKGCYVYIRNKLYLAYNGKVFYKGSWLNVVNHTVVIDGVIQEIYPVVCEPVLVIGNNIYSVYSKSNQGNFIRLDNNILGQNISIIDNLFKLNGKLEPFYGIFITLDLNNNVIYSEGSYIDSNLVLNNTLEPKYGIDNKLNFDVYLLSKGNSYINSQLKLDISMYDKKYTPTIPPDIFVPLLINNSIRNYFVEEPTIYVIV